MRPKHVANGNSRLQLGLRRSIPLRYARNVYTLRCDAAWISRKLTDVSVQLAAFSFRVVPLNLKFLTDSGVCRN